MGALVHVTTPEHQQALIDGLTALLSDKKGIDEAIAKQLRKAANNMATAQQAEGSALDASLSATAEKLLTEVREKTHQQIERREQDYEKVISLLNDTDKSVKANELKKAEESIHKLLSILGTIPGLSNQRKLKIDKRLNRIQPQIRKLESWRHWGTTQARQDLMEQVKLLVGSRLHPKELARTIEDARNQWRDWDKGGDHSKQALWTEFDTACKEAFVPCTVYFGERKKARKDALGARRAMIDGINQRYSETDWNSPDYKDLDKWLRGQRRDFFKTENVDFKQRKKITATLDEAVEQFETHLSQERTRCFKTRQKLVEDVQALGLLEDSKSAMDQLESLKKRWVVTVIEKPGLEDKLWKQYQKACDAIYAKRKEARKQQDVQFNQNLKDKNALIEQLYQVVNLEPQAMLNERSRFNQLIDQYKEIGYVPRKHEKSVQNRFNQIRKQIDKGLVARESAKQNEALNQLHLQSTLCSQLEAAIQSGKKLDSITKQWPENGAQASMQKRYEQAIKAREGSGFDSKQLTAHYESKLEYCLKLEVNYDLDSPAEFQKQRMAYQIERLAASMKKNTAAQYQPDELILKLLCLGAVPAQHIDSMQARIQSCFDKHFQATQQ